MESAELAYLQAVDNKVGAIWAEYDAMLAVGATSPDQRLDAAYTAVADAALGLRELKTQNDIRGAIAVYAGAIAVLQADESWPYAYDAAKAAAKATSLKVVVPYEEPAYVAIYGARVEFGLHKPFGARVRETLSKAPFIGQSKNT